MTEEAVVCVGPCERIFKLSTETQKDRGKTDKGWLCPICRWNEQSKDVVGFIERKF